MTTKEIETATREQLANELGAAGEYTGDWRSADMDDLRERVRVVVAHDAMVILANQIVLDCGHRAGRMSPQQEGHLAKARAALAAIESEPVK